VKDNLIAVAIVLVIVALAVCQTAVTVKRIPNAAPLSLGDYVTGSRTPEATFLEVDWLKDEN